jgi:hypothetical protein
MLSSPQRGFGRGYAAGRRLSRQKLTGRTLTASPAAFFFLRFGRIVDYFGFHFFHHRRRHLRTAPNKRTHLFLLKFEN